MKLSAVPQRHVYTRDELFKIARNYFATTLPNKTEALASLAKLERNCDDVDNDGQIEICYKATKDCKQQERELDDALGVAARRTLASFGRKRSELAAEVLAGEKSAQTRLVRMTSSPAIKYTSRQAVMSRDSVFIEPPRAAGASCDIKSSRRSEQFAMRRHQKMFEAPMRRNEGSNCFAREQGIPSGRFDYQENNERHKDIGGGDDDDDDEFGPMSLPVLLAASPQPRQRAPPPIRHIGRANYSQLRKLHSLEDDNYQADQCHNNASSRVWAEHDNKSRNDDNDDDDFDIASLLSITVLSDIKTIRHLDGGAPSSAPKRATIAGKQEAPLKLRQLVRSKSTLGDFSAPLQSRLPPVKLHAQASLERRANERQAWRGPAELPVADAYESLPPLHQRATSLRASLQRQQDNWSPVAQSGLASKQSHGEVSSRERRPVQTDGLVLDPQMAFEYHLKCRLQTERAKNDSLQASELAKRAEIVASFRAQVKAREEAAAAAAISAGATATAKAEAAAAKPQCDQQQEQQTRPDKARAEQETLQQGGTEAGQVLAPSMRRVSNIPRLTALRRDKFVSQYKLLSGKSLADELAEVSSSSASRD